MLAAERVVPPIYNMWQKEQLCDAEVTTADSTLRAHRVVLAAFSEKLLEEFLKEDQEKPSHKMAVDLSGFSSAALNNVVRFCYTGEFDKLTDDTIEDTLMCCRRLDLKFLLDRCVDYLARYNVSNALFYYDVCRRCELATLSERIWIFACANFEAIAKSPYFLKCKKDFLIQLLSETRLNAPSEMRVLEAAMSWLEFEAKTRVSDAPDVINCVRLSLIKPEDIIAVAEPKVRSLASGDPYPSLFRAMAFHGLRKSQSALTPRFASQPRAGSIDIIDELPLKEAQENTSNHAQNVSKGNQDVTKYTQNITSGPQDITKGTQNVTNDNQDVTEDEKNNTKGSQGVTQNVTRDTQGVTKDTKNGTKGSQDNTKSTQNVIKDTQGVTKDTKNGTKGTKYVTKGTKYVTKGTQKVEVTKGTQDVISDSQDVTKGAHNITKDNQDVTKGAQDITKGSRKSIEDLTATIKTSLEKVLPLQKLRKTRLLNGKSRTGPQVRIKESIYITGGVDLCKKSEQQGLCISKSSVNRKSWEVCSRIRCETHHHAAVALFGEIYIIGGFIYDSVDFSDYGKPTDLVSVYDPNTDAWTSASKMMDSRAHHGAVVYEKKIYVVCGMNHYKQVLETVEQYDPLKDQWTIICKLPRGRLGAAIALCQHYIYIVGGYNRYLEFPILDEILCLDLKSLNWIKTKPFGVPICHASLTCVHDQLYLVGGRTLLIEKSGEELLWSTRSSDIILKCDPKTQEWEAIDHLKCARHDATVAVSGSTLVIMGGMCSPTKASLSSVECYDTEKKIWINDYPELPFAVSGASAVCVENA